MPAQTPKGIGGKLGEIVEAGDAGFTVVCADGRINVLRVKGPDGGKVSAGDFVKSANLAPGAQTGIDIHMPASQHQNPKSDIEISQAAKMTPIAEIARTRLGIPRDEPRAVRPLQGQGVDGLRQVAEGSAERQADPGLGDHADAGRRRQDHDHGGTDRRAQQDRQEGDDVPARALARALVRDEGRRGRRRLRASGADGRHQPPFHRRLPRHHVGEQPAGGDARQQHLLGQPARRSISAASRGAACST